MTKKRRLISVISLRKYKVKPIRINNPQAYSPREKFYNCIWVFTLGDPDDNPSVPHAHAQERGYRLDAWTGDVYPAGNERKKTIGKLSKKEIEKLHSDSKFLAFANKQIEWYRQNYPNISFYLPEWFEIKLKQMQLYAKKATNNSTFVFTSTVTIFS